MVDGGTFPPAVQARTQKKQHEEREAGHNGRKEKEYARQEQTALSRRRTMKENRNRKFLEQ